MLLPPSLLDFMLSLFRMTLGMSNVPGPDRELDVMGTAKLVEIIPAIGHYASSSIGKLVSLIDSDDYCLQKNSMNPVWLYGFLYLFLPERQP